MQFPSTPAFRSSSPRSQRLVDAAGELRRRLPSLVDELDREHRAEPADVADLRQRSCQARMRARIVSPIAAERSTSPSSSITSRTARAAACATGLPTYVPPTPPVAGRVHDLRLAEHAREREPVAIDFATVIRSGSTPKCSIAKNRPVRAKPLCTSSQTRTIPCSSQIARSPCDELLGRGDEAALALHRLEDDRGDVLGGDERRERASSAAAPRGIAAVLVGTARGRPRARTARAPPCTGASSTSARARATSGRGTRLRSRSPRCGRCRRART